MASKIDEFISAASQGDLARVAKLWGSGGIDINSKGAYWANALVLATHSAHIEVVRYLLDLGADPNPLTEAKSPRAYAQGYDNIARLLLVAEIKKWAAANQEWVRLGDGKIIHTEFFDTSHKLTEIFNLHSREMLTITENLLNGTEETFPAVSFDELSPELLDKVLEQFTALKGVVNKDFVKTGKREILKPVARQG